MAPTTTTPDDREEKTCRICLASAEEREEGFVSPCRCKGTSKYVHRSCLAPLREAEVCPVCLTPYATATYRTPRSVLLGSFYAIATALCGACDVSDVGWTMHITTFLFEGTFFALWYAELVWGVRRGVSEVKLFEMSRRYELDLKVRLCVYPAAYFLSHVHLTRYHSGCGFRHAAKFILSEYWRLFRRFTAQRIEIVNFEEL